ncbi:MAG: recombinase family protein [Planctomycetota bacterium]|nr:recombinase family protein [Planctomycetota bacterium]
MRRKSTREAYSFLFPTIIEMRDGGESFRAIANRLNTDGHTTTRGKPWTATAALRVYRMARAEA